MWRLRKKQNEKINYKFKENSIISAIRFSFCIKLKQNRNNKIIYEWYVAIGNHSVIIQ